MELEQEYVNKGFWAVVVGGSSGLGWATAQQLAIQGMHIALIHRDRKSYLRNWIPQWEQLEKHHVKLKRWNLDALTDAHRDSVLNELEQCIGEEEHVRVFVHALSKGNLKALRGVKPLTGKDIQLTTEAMGINFYRWASEIRKRKLFQPGSRCLGFTSAGNERVWKHYGAVSAAKNVLESLMRSMAVEWGPEGIRSNLIQAGITDTPSLRAIPGYEFLMDQSAKNNPLGRNTKPADIAGVVELLCRSQSDWINGAIIPVDGGEKLL
jgi:enoyl-[acyl-carrier protein] reductase I